MTHAENSLAMSLFRRFGFDSLAWAVRRFHVPVSPRDLVLEVGAGGNPYPRANVLLDAYESTRERHWAPLVSDRPTVLGFVENLPFKDKAFDFVIAAHVLEHSSDPARFISELERVAKAGYIEVPDAFLERINPYKDHRLEITSREGTLVIRKKAGWQADPDVIELYEDRVKPVLTSELIPQHPFEFHVRHYWRNSIRYRVINPEIDAGWLAPPHDRAPALPGMRAGLRALAREALRGMLSQRRRNAAIDLLPLLRCVSCHGTSLQRAPHHVDCTACGTRYALRGSVVVTNEDPAALAA